MTHDDTRDQRLTDADVRQVAALVIRDCTHEGRTGRDWCCADCHHLSNRVLAARSVRDDPTLRERIEAECAKLKAEDDMSQWGSHAQWRAAHRIEAVLAEHAPAATPEDGA